jgi:hypothetical protein
VRWLLINSDVGDIAAMLSLAMSVGFGVTGIMLYMFTRETLKQYAVLKAMGATLSRNPMRGRAWQQRKDTEPAPTWPRSLDSLIGLGFGLLAAQRQAPRGGPFHDFGSDFAAARLRARARAPIA